LRCARLVFLNGWALLRAVMARDPFRIFLSGSTADFGVAR